MYGREIKIVFKDAAVLNLVNYFEYIMFGWGDSPAADYVVMSEKPDESFCPGVRLYFKYADMLRHPGHIFED